VICGKQEPSSGCTFPRLGQDRQGTHTNPFYPRPLTGTKYFQNCTPTQQNLLLCDLASAETARKGSVQQGTQNNHSRSWRQWKAYCESTGLGNDIFLKRIPRTQQPHILSAFAVAMHEGRFLQPADAPLACETVSSSINLVAAAFRSHGYPNPSHGAHGELDWNLARQYRSYKLSDPKKIQQKAVPLSVISLIAQVNMTDLQCATARLVIGAFFFACRSCKYLQVPKPEEKQTKILTLADIAFFKNNVKLPHTTSLMLATADRVSITFVSQKNGRKNDTITQWKMYNKVLCPVLQWAAIIHCISKYTGTTSDTPVLAFWARGHIKHVTGKIVENALGDSVVALGEAKLCIYHHKIGTHSICAGAAMAMYLSGVPVFAIMLIGRWSSTAFMNYTRKQIKEFSLNISTSMLSVQHFTAAKMT
jgi:hypothetical protein